MNLIKGMKNNLRHKLIFVKEEPDDFQFVDIGKELSRQLNELESNKRISFAAKRELNKILNRNTQEYMDLGEYVAIKNIGILFEPEIRLDVKNFFQENSKNNLLIVLWEGDILDKEFYYLTKENGISLNLEDTSLIVL